jgi:hypothetical protein
LVGGWVGRSVRARTYSIDRTHFLPVFFVVVAVVAVAVVGGIGVPPSCLVAMVRGLCRWVRWGWGGVGCEWTRARGAGRARAGGR